jgi:LysR family hydrogen peroxide-inducible transcriptional activator
MTNLTLRQLRYFESLAAQGHFGRAAEVSNISQPALSMQIRQMETALGCALFERGARAVTLTEFGRSFAPRARAILQQVDELDELARIARGPLTGRLRLGVIPTVAPYLLPRLVQDMTAQYPGLDLHLRETVTPRLIDDLHAGRLDAAILALPVSESGLTETPLLDEDFVLIRPAQDRGRPVPDAQALSTMRLLLLEEGHCFRDQALDFCSAGTTPREVMEGSSLATLVQMVAAGIGVTLIPEMACALETRAAPVVIDRFPAPAPHRRIGMVWRATTPLADRLTDLAHHLAGTLTAPSSCPKYSGG